MLVKQLFKLRYCNSVVRIGGIPTLRFWRDLEHEFKHTPVINYTDVPYSGLSRESTVKDMTSLVPGIADFPFHQLMNVRQLDIKLQGDKETLFEKYPLSEQALTFQLSNIVGTDSVYLGNSMPIRNWDQFAQCDSINVYASRGANGIDGQISTYLGWSQAYERSYCIIGDLTALYDLASLGLTTQLNTNQRNVVIINNFGGQIFNRVFKNNDFINAHKTQFGHWAQMWGWNYVQVSTLADMAKVDGLQSERNVIEIVPNAQQTQAFWTEWDQLCQSV
jgi:2-succinyl-5-enolpyruvyl-6-hydroxy-3-cyclohexene-1-carboxylate synthase